MLAKIFDGKSYASQKLARLETRGKNLCLASIFLNSDPGSVLYTKLKKAAAESVGIKFLPFEIKQKNVQEIVDLIQKLNSDVSVGGILVQKPSGTNDFNADEWKKIVLSLNPQKDIDGLTPENLGLLSIGRPRYIPATVKAVLEVIKVSGIELLGKNVVIVGASEILGKPLSMILTDIGATVSILHNNTENIGLYSRQADILISATGSPGLINESLIKEGAVVIDVGAPNGDVKTEEVTKKASFLSPVPGGVGPLTIFCLLENLVIGCQK